MIDYTGTTALVTGAASGIGRVLALALAARGARLILVDINADGLAQTAAAIGPDTLTLAADLADPAEPARIVEQGFAAAGRIDLICSNAGVVHGRRLVREKLDANGGRTFAVNLFAGLYLVQAYAQALERTSQRGRVMFTGSENSLSVPAAVAGMGLGLYASTKHALLIAAEWMRDEFAGRTPIDLHVLLPGPIITAMSGQAPEASPMEFIPAERCAELALNGLDLGLFYIPTHAHIADDMRARFDGVAAAVKALGVG